MRGLAIFEAIVGQLYLAILVARLVGLRTPHNSMKPAGTRIRRQP